jgi:hypothetical protein
MENLNGFRPDLKKSKSENSSSSINRTLRKYYGQLQSMMFRQTLSDKRRALFGKDPFAA